MMYSAKRLDKSGMNKLQEMEQKLGLCIVAWEKKPGAASISEDQLSEVQKLEKEMDAVLVVYDCKK